MSKKMRENENSYHGSGKDMQGCEISRILSLDPAGIYPNMTEDTKGLYLSLVLKNAKKAKISGQKYAQMLLDIANSEKSGKKRHIGYPLFVSSKSSQYAYFILFFGALAIFLLLLYLISPFCLLAFPCVWVTVKYLCDLIFSHLRNEHHPLRMKTDEIKSESAVLVVITSVLSGEKTDHSLFEKLELIYHSNGGKNIYFGMLGDLSDFSSAKAPGDERTINYAYGRIDALNQKYGKHFILFERRRSYSKTEESFIGWDRERGALIELVRFLRGEATTFSTRSLALAREILGSANIKYIVTLDSDANLPLGAVKDMYDCMLHPLCRPEIDKKRGEILSGHAKLLPMHEVGLRTLSCSPFSQLFRDNESYFQNGIFDVDAFKEIIDNGSVFPEDYILNDEELYSSRLCASVICDVRLQCGFQKSSVSYIGRLHERVRGDIQNLRFALPYTLSGSNIRKKNRLSRLCRFKLFDRALQHFAPCFAFICIFISVFVSPYASSAILLGSLLYIFLPAIKCFSTSLFTFSYGCITRKFFSSGVSTSLWQSIFKAFFSLSMLAQSALTCFDAITKSLYRMIISKRHFLERKNDFHDEENSPSLIGFVHRNIFSPFAGFLLFAFARGGFVRFIALLWLAFPVISYHTSFFRKKGSLGDKKSLTSTARKYALDIWRFFEDNVTEKDNFLPPDSIQLFPCRKTHHKTGPESIGLYLLSVLCARDFGFISTEIMQEKITGTLPALEKMKKHRGHLSVSYSTEDLSVLAPERISTKDSGILTACLITLKAGLREYVFESTSLLELIARLERLESSTDYSFLYNSERNLFSYGADVCEDKGFIPDRRCFEFLMSESRLISYIECARRKVPECHWQTLSRELVSEGGYIGLSSHSGSASEYFLPSIFLPVCKSSLLYEASIYALRAQRHRSAKSACGMIFGCSECFYGELDTQMNYRRGVFGIPSLSSKKLRNNDFVISPYSSFISLCVGERYAFKNLEIMKKAGLYGEYGFFEAIDFTPGRCGENGSAVTCYSSAHLGMSLASLCNTAFDGILCARFMRNSDMACARILLEEKIPVNPTVTATHPDKTIAT